MNADRPSALKIANEVMDAVTINPHLKSAAWPLELFVPLARDYLRMTRPDLPLRTDEERAAAGALFHKEK